MKYTQIIFSPTGGTAKVSRILADTLSTEYETIDLMKVGNSQTFGAEDVCIIAMPVFSGRVPAVAVERLKALKVNGSQAIIVTVYGNRAIDDALVEMLDEVKDCGFTVIAAIKAVAEHSIMRQYGVGRPDAEDKADLQSFAKSILEKLALGNDSEPSVPGNRPYKTPAALPMQPKRNKKCNQCGLCEKQCPVGAIDLTRKNPVDKDRCITCMHCVSICPKQAVKLNPLMVKIAALTMKKAFVERKTNELYI